MNKTSDPGFSKERAKAIKQNFKTLLEVYKTTREVEPAKTVAELVQVMGYETALETVAELVNTVGEWDRRVPSHMRLWARCVKTAATPEELVQHSIWQPSEIHPQHIAQLANAMMVYQKESEDGKADA